MDREFDLIVAIVNRGFSDLVMDAARAAGASGGTILHGRGTGVHEAEQFFGIAIQPEKEIVLILTRSDERRKTLRAGSRAWYKRCEQATGQKLRGNLCAPERDARREA